MDKTQSSTLTVLTCQAGKVATKKFFVGANGSIEKRQFSAGVFFTHEEQQVCCLGDLARVLESLLDKPDKLVIRGIAKPSANRMVRRKMTEPGAAFDSCARPYVMLDIDKQTIPAHFDAINNPDEIITWVQQMLPKPFRDASCYYQFSSSQNVPLNVGDQPLPTVSAHLWFWLEQAVSDAELKRYFQVNPAPVDRTLFNAVQAHYTARPLFDGIDDPLPRRSGVVTGEYDAVPTLTIPVEEPRTPRLRKNQEPDVSVEDRETAIVMLLPFYQKGTRDRFCGAVAGTLYRGGWNAENTADFIHELAIRAADDEVDARYSGAWRICAAIDDGHRAQGTPTLRDEFKVERLDDILALLGIGPPDIGKAITGLWGVNDTDRIIEVIKLLVPLPKGKQKAYIEQISAITKHPKSVLKAFLVDAANEIPPVSALDRPDVMMERLLSWEYEGGRHLVRAPDGMYWHYTGTHWERLDPQAIKKKMLNYAREIVEESDVRIGVSSLLTAGMNIIEGRVYEQCSPLHALVTPSVINCLNGELWFDDAGTTTFKPHMAESYLKHRLNVFYDPHAKAPMFEEAVMGIFANSQNPQEMFRHFMELAGYICQPWRKLASIILLYGGGNNGKSSLMGIVQNVLGHRMIAYDRMSKVEDSAFKMGALDGKLLLLDDDMDEGTCLPDGFLKKISEEKSLTAEHKHKNPFEFVCRAVPVMLSNTYPASRDVSEGMRRRMKVIPFSRHFKPEEVKIGLFDRIWEEEAAGILNLFVEGFQRLKRRGKFDEPMDCLTAKMEWFTRSNTLPTFIAECCEEGDVYREHIGDFYKAFERYCAEIGVKNVMKQPTVADRLASLGYKVGILNGKKAVYGLRIKAEAITTIDLR